MGRSLGKDSKERLAAREFYSAAFYFAFYNCQGTEILENSINDLV